MDVDGGSANECQGDITSGADQLLDAEREKEAVVASKPDNLEEEVEAADAEDDEEHFQRERKRKGKMKTIPLPKKKRVSRPASRTMIIQEPSQPVMEISDSDKSQDSDASYYGEEGGSEGDSDTSFVDSGEEQELISYDGMEVEIEKEDVEELERSQDSRRFRTHQQVHIPSLVQVGVKSYFVHAFQTIGFDWFLLLEVDPVPHGLAHDFFSSFDFRVTTDLDECNISFFIVQYRVSDEPDRVGCKVGDSNHEGSCWCWLPWQRKRGAKQALHLQ